MLGALLAKALQHSGKRGVSAPPGTLMREIDKPPESHSGVQKFEYHELLLQAAELLLQDDQT